MKGETALSGSEAHAGSSMTSCMSTTTSSATSPNTTEGQRKVLQDGLHGGGESSLGDGSNNGDGVVVSVQGVGEATTIEGSMMEECRQEEKNDGEREF